MIPSKPIVNIAAYKFVTLDDLERRRVELRTLCRNAGLKGTILVTPEGINMFIAGSRTAVDTLLNHLRQEEIFADLEVKESFSKEQPFERMLVKIKSEIITFGIEGVDPRDYTSKKIPPKQLKEWLDAGDEVILLDTRNDYEVKIGTFDNAVPVGVDHFRDFPKAVSELPDEFHEKPVVMFCTGGIRCEKAGPFMEKAGFKNIYQLEGGILKYFEECGSAHYQGECFVFDKRVALDPELKETGTEMCYACLAPLSLEDQESPFYFPPHACPHCYASEEELAAKLMEERHQKLLQVTTPLPGSVPYDNVRPLNVAEKFAGLTLLQFLNARHPHMGEDFWLAVCTEGRIHRRGKAVPADRVVQSGNQFAHLEPATTEPFVSNQIQILHEDDSIVVVNKPAPLPTHPSGRFNRNTLEWILNEVFHPFKLRPAHRLDAKTTGVVVLCKKRTVSQFVQPQFENGTVEKTYLALVNGGVPWDEFTCEEAISKEPTQLAARTIDPDGLPARTRFEKVRVNQDGTSLLRVFPKTGRTHQIRVHLWHLGFPICGDPIYLPDHQLNSDQTVELETVMCLHAKSLSMIHPDTCEQVTFIASDPLWSANNC